MSQRSHESWLHFPRYQERPERSVLARLQNDPANQVVIDSASEAGEDILTPVESGNAPNDAGQPMFSAAGILNDDSQVHPTEFSIRCQQFLADIHNQEDQILSILRCFSSDLTTYIDLLLQWQPSPTAVAVRAALRPLLHAAGAYTAAFEVLRQLETHQISWWANYQTEGMTANELDQVIAWGKQLQEGQKVFSSPDAPLHEGKSVTWKQIRTRRTGQELKPMMEGIGRMLVIWAQSEEEDDARLGVVLEFEMKCRAQV